MTRLYIFAEGQTEQTFGDTVLKEHLAAFGVYVQRPVLIAHARKKGVVHRGGGRQYSPMKNDILWFLKQEKSPDVYFTTMIDLYALPVDFPGMNKADKLRNSPYDRVKMLEGYFAEDINDPFGRPSRFLHFLKKHPIFPSYALISRWRSARPARPGPKFPKIKVPSLKSFT